MDLGCNIRRRRVDLLKCTYHARDINRGRTADRRRAHRGLLSVMVLRRADRARRRRGGALEDIGDGEREGCRLGYGGAGGLERRRGLRAQIS